MRRQALKWGSKGAVCLLVAMFAGAAFAQQPAAAYVVQQQWVQADENYLASDALHGRGSGTKDELAAAEWVSKRFAEFGLTPAPGMPGYLQAAELSAPLLDGHSVLMVGSITLEEGKDFVLVTSSGASANGMLGIYTGGDAQSARGGVLLARPVEGKTSMQAVAPLRRAGAALILMQQDASTDALYTVIGNKTRVPVGLKDGGPPARAAVSLVALKSAAFVALSGLDSHTAVSLVVKNVKQAEPRKTYNAIGYLKGTDASAGTLLLTAHLDHLGVSRDAAGKEVIFHGANDDAAGTTAVLELARALTTGPKPKRSVLFVCYGSEEIGELGSTYFGAHPPVPLKELVANLEFEMIGAQDPKMPKGVLLLTGWERSDLGPELKAHGALLGPDPYPEQHFFERSDNYALALDGVVAHTAAGWGTVPTYHQPTDDLAHLDVPFMTAAIQSLVAPVEWLVSSDFVPRWKPGGQPSR